MMPRYFIFDESHEEFRRSVRSFVEREIAPHVDEWERARAFPRELFPQAAALGLLGVKYPEDLGGVGADLLHEAVLIEELARGASGGVSASLGAHNEIATPPMMRLGTDEQRRRLLGPCIRGEAIAALAITEPGAGSDVAGLSTHARRDGGDYVVNGQKTFITNGHWCDLAVVAVRTSGESGHDGISLLVIERGPGFESSPQRMMPWRTSQTAEITFTDCRVPAANLLGEEGRGFRHIMENFQWERLSMALGAVAGAQKTYEVAYRYAQDRVAFGRPIARFQVQRHRLAHMATEIEKARQLTYHALWLHLAGEPSLAAVSMAKMAATDTACRVADEAVQIHGGYGYMMEFEVQRHWRDARLGPIGGGTNEVMAEIIARELDI
ncbi:MAG: acyl-CoA dehydrogenase family protein [Candidatus Dormibacteria bacterium]